MDKFNKINVKQYEEEKSFHSLQPFFLMKPLDILNTHIVCLSLKNCSKIGFFENKKSVINIDKMDYSNETNTVESPITVCDVDLLTEKKEEQKKQECLHNIIVDYIDITPDRSARIKYCDKCFVTIDT
jgi:hypothetical protein